MQVFSGLGVQGLKGLGFTVEGLGIYAGVNADDAGKNIYHYI